MIPPSRGVGATSVALNREAKASPTHPTHRQGFLVLENSFLLHPLRFYGILYL